MKKTTETPVKVVTDITCDACGTTVVPDVQKTYRENLNDFDEFGVLQAAYGYGSSHDGDSFHFDLCEKCFGELIDRIRQLRVSHGLNK